MMTRRLKLKLTLAAGAVLLGAGCAPGTGGIIVLDSDDLAAAEVTEGSLASLDEPISVSVPRVPPIALPDLSAISDFSSVLEEELGALATAPGQGVDLATARCDAKGGQLVFSGNESTGIFEGRLGFNPQPFDFDIDENGAGTYVKDRAVSGLLSLRTYGDGSGTLLDKTTNRHMSANVRSDGSGEYYLRQDNIVTTIESHPGGAGVFTRDDPRARVLTTVTIEADGSGELYSLGEDNALTVNVNSDGSGEYFSQQGTRLVTVLVRSDGSWEFKDVQDDTERRLLVNSDGSGQYADRGGEQAIILDFDSSGLSEQGPTLVVPERPLFQIASQFPRMGQLSALAPPCATVIRFDSQLLFEVDSADLKAGAGDALDEAVRVLAGTGRAIEVNGHTDATGSDEYNQELSLARAQSVADALRQRGLDLEIAVNGFGESQPIAPDYDDEGNDNEEGQALNRRVEVVIQGQ